MSRKKTSSSRWQSSGKRKTSPVKESPSSENIDMDVLIKELSKILVRLNEATMTVLALKSAVKQLVDKR